MGILFILEKHKMNNTISENKNVQKFLEEVKVFDNEKYNILQELRKIVFMNFKETTERIMYGGIMFSLEKDFGGIFISKNHVSFEFTEGFRMNDPDKLLQGIGKYRRHLKIKVLSEIKDKKVDFFVKQTV